MAITEKLSGIESKHAKLVSQSSNIIDEVGLKNDTKYNTALPPPIHIIPFSSTSPGSSAKVTRCEFQSNSLNMHLVPHNKRLVVLLPMPVLYPPLGNQIC
jgi:hypothetical protein